MLQQGEVGSHAVALEMGDLVFDQQVTEAWPFGQAVVDNLCFAVDNLRVDDIHHLPKVTPHTLLELEVVGPKLMEEEALY